MNKSSASLKIQNLGYGDAGNCTCLVFFTQGVPRPTSWFLHVQDLPVVSVSDNMPTENEQISALCCVDLASGSVTFPNIQWDLLPQNSFHFTSTSNRTVEVKTQNVISLCSTFSFTTNRYQTSVKCLIVNALNLSSSARFNVQYPAEVYLLKNTKIWNETNNRPFAISCLTHGNPLPTVSLQMLIFENWITVFSKSSLVLSDTTFSKVAFFIDNWHIEPSGVYRCIANNSIGPNATSREVSFGNPFGRSIVPSTSQVEDISTIASKHPTIMILDVIVKNLNIIIAIGSTACLFFIIILMRKGWKRIHTKHAFPVDRSYSDLALESNFEVDDMEGPVTHVSIYGNISHEENTHEHDYSKSDSAI